MSASLEAARAACAAAHEQYVRAALVRPYRSLAARFGRAAMYKQYTDACFFAARAAEAEEALAHAEAGTRKSARGSGQAQERKSAR